VRYADPLGVIRLSSTLKKMDKQNKLVPVEQSAQGLISQAIDKGVSVETMEKLMTLQERWEKNQAKKAFDEAISNFQKSCPVIAKTKKVLNKDGRTIRYQYAPLEAIIEQIKGILSDNSLSYKWEVENKENAIRAIAIVSHIAGHSETSSFEVPIDKEGFMTAPQKYASALTFAKRYAFCDVLGISTADEDTDATDVNKEPDVKSTKAKIMLLLRTLGRESKTKAEVEKSIKDLVQLPLSEKNYAEIVSRLEALVKERDEYENSQV